MLRRAARIRADYSRLRLRLRLKQLLYRRRRRRLLCRFPDTSRQGAALPLTHFRRARVYIFNRSVSYYSHCASLGVHSDKATTGIIILWCGSIIRGERIRKLGEEDRPVCFAYYVCIRTLCSSYSSRSRRE
jgi:hypothetical protein